MKYRLKDNQIAGRYYGVDVIFDSKEEIRDTLIEALSSEDDFEFEEDYSKLSLEELLEMADYEIEEVGNESNYWTYPA